MDRLDSQSTLSNWWRIHVVTKRQGCVISPGLYNIYSERIMLCVVEEHHDGITIGGRKDTNLRYADEPCCAHVTTSCWPCSNGSNKSASPKTYCHTKDTYLAVLKGSETKEDFIPDEEKIE